MNAENIITTRNHFQNKLTELVLYLKTSDVSYFGLDLQNVRMHANFTFTGRKLTKSILSLHIPVFFFQ